MYCAMLTNVYLFIIKFMFTYKFAATKLRSLTFERPKGEKQKLTAGGGRRSYCALLREYCAPAAGGSSGDLRPASNASPEKQASQSLAATTAHHIEAPA